MKRLRLIKPWGLRTVRQHLATGERSSEHHEFSTCNGPIIADEAILYSSRFGQEDIRTMGSMAFRIAAPEAADHACRISAPAIR